MYLLGIIISICGNVLISISLNIQVGDGIRDPAQIRHFTPHSQAVFLQTVGSGLAERSSEFQQTRTASV